MKLYADDVLIYRLVNCTDDYEMLQRDLNTLQAWAHKWNMPFNSAKYEFLKASNKQNTLSFPYAIHSRTW